ncbi:MAG: hypothetical protein FJW40_03275 [Acidobacteria bacterium]|nr:hypothetical protein [Acidobacteriota bacterium]
MRSAPLLLSFLVSSMASAQYFSELAREDGFEIVRLVNAGSRTEVRIVPSLGANAYSMKVNGQEIFWSPFKTLTEFKAKPTLNGNPFLAPWANRIDGDGYTVNGKRYQLNGALGNFRRDGNGNPIHGLVVYASEWTVASRLARFSHGI